MQTTGSLPAERVVMIEGVGGAELPLPLRKKSTLPLQDSRVCETS